MSGNVFGGTSPIKKEHVQQVYDLLQVNMPPHISLIRNIGSAGFKSESGDIDVFLDAGEVKQHFDSEDDKHAKIALAHYFINKGFEAKILGRNVHLKFPYTVDHNKKEVQIDLMLIPNAAKVADWHQHGPRGMYDVPEFKAGHLFMLLNSIGKFLGLKIDAFTGSVKRRDDNSVVADTRAKAAKILLSPDAKATDLNSVASVMNALRNDPDKEGKLMQARADVNKGILTLPEDITPGTAAWFRKMSNITL